MALSIGELTGYLDLDAGPFEKAIGSAMDSMGDKKFQVAGAAAGLAAGTALAAGLMGAIEMDGATRKMNAGLGLVGADAEKAGAAAGNLYSKGYGESMDDVTTATGAVISSIGGMRDASAGDIETVTASILDMAAAFDVDVAEASATVGSLMKNGLATDATQAMDLIVGSMQKVPQAMQGEILPIMDEYGKHFAALGIDGETAMGIIVASSADGAIGMDKMGDALKEFTIRGTDMSKSTGEAYSTLGLNQKDMTDQLLAGGDTAEGAMAKIVGGLQNIKDPGEQAAAAIALFGTPLEDLGTDQIPGFLGMIDPMGDAFESTAGAAAAMGEEINGGPAVAVETLSRTIQTSLMEAVAGMVPFLTPMVNLLTSMAPVIGPLALALGAFAGAIWLVQGAMSAWKTVQLIMNAAMWASPITWIIAAVILLIAVIWLIVTNWESISVWLVSAGAAFAAWWGEFWSGVGAWISEVWGGFINWIKQVWSGFTGWLASSGAALSAWWTGLWSSIGAWASSTWRQIVQTITKFVTDLAAKIHTGIDNAVNWVRSGFTNAKLLTISIWMAIVAWIMGIPGKILSGLSALGKLGATAAGWFGKVKDSAVSKFNDVVAWVKGVPGNIVGALGSLGSLLWNAGGQILQGFLDGLKAGFENVKNFVGGIGSWIANNKGPKAYDLALLVPAGGWIMEGLGTGIEDSMPGLASTLGDVSWMIANGIDPEVSASGSYAFGGSGSGNAAATGTTVSPQISVTEADNAQATAELVWQTLQFRLNEAGVRIGSFEPVS